MKFFPENEQLFVRTKNFGANYFQSVWLGTFFNVLMFPRNVFMAVLMPILRGLFIAILGAFTITALYTLTLILGLFGRLDTIKVDGRLQAKVINFLIFGEPTQKAKEDRLIDLGLLNK